MLVNSRLSEVARGVEVQEEGSRSVGPGFVGIQQAEDEIAFGHGNSFGCLNRVVPAGSSMSTGPLPRTCFCIM